MKLPSKSEILDAVAKLKAQGLITVRPPPDVAFETLKRRMSDNEAKRASRAAARQRYEANNK